MSSFNKVILLGNLTRDPELKNLGRDNSVCNFGLATNRKFTRNNGEKGEEVCFVDCAAFGKIAEVVNKYCQKGNLLHVEGRLKFETWDDKQGGGKRSKLSVLVESVQLMPNKDGGERNGSSAGGRAASGASTSTGSSASQYPRDRESIRREQSSAPVGGPYDGNEQQFQEDDIPF